MKEDWEKAWEEDEVSNRGGLLYKKAMGVLLVLACVVVRIWIRQADTITEPSSYKEAVKPIHAIQWDETYATAFVKDVADIYYTTKYPSTFQEATGIGHWELGFIREEDLNAKVDIAQECFWIEGEEEALQQFWKDVYAMCVYEHVATKAVGQDTFEVTMCFHELDFREYFYSAGLQVWEFFDEKGLAQEEIDAIFERGYMPSEYQEAWNDYIITHLNSILEQVQEVGTKEVNYRVSYSVQDRECEIEEVGAEGVAATENMDVYLGIFF